MTRQSFDLEIITPCFCAGANPAEAEIRAPSIRGQLRWWFRVLGGSATEESRVFGAVAGESGVAGAVRISIADFKRGPVWNPPQIDQNKAENYTWHFASASGKPVGAGREVTGPRWQSRGAIPPGSSFKLLITHQRAIAVPLKVQFDAALSAFLCFGTIGLRATRGLGAFHCHQAKPWQEVMNDLTKNGFRAAIRQNPDTFPTWEAALKDWSAWLRYHFRNPDVGGIKAKNFSSLGGIAPRQTSAVRFRPLKSDANRFTWVALEAPHGRTLSRSTSERITPSLLTGPAPIPAPRRAK